MGAENHNRDSRPAPRCPSTVINSMGRVSCFRLEARRCRPSSPVRGEELYSFLTTMKRTKQIREAIFDFNFSKLLSECNKQTITNEFLIELIELVKQSGCLLLQHAVPARESQRDSFFESLRRWLSAQGSEAAIELLERHRKQAGI